MTTHRLFAPITTAMLSALILLTGCTEPNTITPTTSTPTPSTGSSASPVDAPKSRDEAWIQANNTIDQFIQVQYGIEKDGGASSERINPFASGDALISMQKIASDLHSQGLRVTGGPPGWEPNPSASSFGDLRTQAGVPVANGIVYVLGCWDLSQQSTVASSGTPPTDRKVRRFPLQFNVTYFPETQIWMVTKQANITGEPGAVQC